MVGGGVLGDGPTTVSQEYKYVVRPQHELLDQTPGLNWIKQAVTSFDPENNSINLADGSSATYDILVVNPGCQLRFDMIEGAQEALDDPDAPVSSIYTLQSAYKTSVLREGFRGGNAIFTCPSFPIKCGGAPQKILYLSEATFRQNGVRDRTNLKYFTATPMMFPPSDEFNEALGGQCSEKGIESHLKHNLISIDKDNRRATFKIMGTDDTVT